MGRLVQLVTWRDFVLGLDDLGRIWAFYPEANRLVLLSLGIAELEPPPP